MDNTNFPFDIHADDYALSKSSDSDILDLCTKGALNSISILPNLAIFPQSVKAFTERKATFPHPLKVSVHLNFMEGKCVADKSLLPDLVDENGYFKISWGKLLLWNYNPFARGKIKKQLKTEIIAQTEKCIESLIINKDAIRFDSHQHPHMIPLVFDALLCAINEKGYKVEYIRNPLDPIHLYLSERRFYKTFSLANIVKCLILNHFSKKVQKATKALHLKQNILCGVFYSGKMDKERVSSVLPNFTKDAKKKSADLEVLFHPGLMKSEELTDEFTKEGFNDFHLSINRSIEKESASLLATLRPQS